VEAIIERACGIDVHQAVVVATLIVGGPHERARKETRQFGTFTRDLNALREWLASEGCTEVAMESTGVYWMPVYAVLEEHFRITIGNARLIKNVPGRKTDVKDSEWLAQLLRHGLIPKSFVPPKPIRELRDLTRYRTKLVQSRTAERNRLLKLLEEANVKLSSVMSDVFGSSGMLMLASILDAKDTPAQAAQLAKGKLRKKLLALECALEGHVEDHHRFLLRMQLERIRQVDQQIAELDARIELRIAPFKRERDLLVSIPGISRVAAASIIAELGVDMTVFGSIARVSSWAGVCPGNNESAGKRKRAKKRDGNVHLTTILVECASAAARKKGSYFKDKFHRLKSRRGYKRALIALAHKILVVVYKLLTTNSQFKDLGDGYLDSIHQHRMKNVHVKRLQSLGYDVVLKERPQPADVSALSA
jgi:transposase